MSETTTVGGTVRVYSVLRSSTVQNGLVAELHLQHPDETIVDINIDRDDTRVFVTTLLPEDD